MGWDWWDIIDVKYGNGRFSQLTLFVPEGNHSVEFRNLGYGGDGRTGYLYGTLQACPAGFENGAIRSVAFTKTPAATPTTSTWPQQTSCAVGTGDDGSKIAVTTIATRTYATWGMTRSVGIRVDK